jgi:hypothetical protein
MIRVNLVPQNDVKNIFNDEIKAVSIKNKKRFKSNIDSTTIYRFFIESDEEMNFKNEIFSEKDPAVFYERNEQTPLEILDIDSGVEKYKNDINKNGSVDVTIFLETGGFSLENSDIFISSNKNQVSNIRITNNKIFFDHSDHSYKHFETILPFSDSDANARNKISNYEINSSGENALRNNIFHSSGFTYKSGNYTNGIDSIVFGGKTK